jgi:CheY-like chemotaxis protein
MDDGGQKLESGCIEARRVLVVDPDSVFRVGLSELLVTRGFTPTCCSDADTAIRLLGRGSYVGIWTEAALEGKLDGCGLLHKARERAPGALLLLVTGGELPTPDQLPEGARALTKKDAAGAVRLLTSRYAAPEEILRIA